MLNLFTGTRARATLALALTLTATAATIAAPAATASTRSTVTAKPTSGYVAVSTAVSVKGAVAPAPTARTVTLQKYSGGKWVNVTSGTTGTKGAYALKVPTTAVSAFTYRVYASAKGTYASAISASFKVTVVVKTTVTIALSKTAVQWLGSSTAKGSIAPGHSGRPVYIQRYNFDTKKWVNIASGTTGYKGAYAVTVKANEPHGWSQNVRAFIPSKTGLSNAASKTVMLKQVDGGYWTSPDGCWLHFPDNSQTPASDAPDRCGFLTGRVG